MFRRGIERLEAEEDPPSPIPMSAEQHSIRHAQFLGAFSVIDWEALSLGDSLLPSVS